MKGASRASRFLFGFQKLALGASVALCGALSVCYLVRPDPAAAVTVYPVWVWLGPGLLLVAMGWGHRTRRAAALVGLLWLGYLLALAEEPRSLIRHQRWPTAAWERARDQGRGVRVVSFNARGEADAAEEIAQYHPDVVLLQESPAQRHVKALTAKLFGDDGEFMWSHDTSIIVRGSLSPLEVVMPDRVTLTLARVRLKSGPEMNAISTHLASPTFRLRLWSRDCWRDQEESRLRHRRQMEGMKALIDTLPSSVPLMIGGDFNSPQGDAVYRLMRPRLHDTFREGGIGWGNTAFNYMPVLRVDEVWVSDEFRATGVVARKTVNSDHRMVVCDLVMKARKAAALQPRLATPALAEQRAVTGEGRFPPLLRRSGVRELGGGYAATHDR